MNTRFVFFVVVVTFIFTIFSGCKRGDGFKESSSGLKYKFHLQNKDSVQVVAFDIVNVLMNYRTKDTMLFQSGMNPISFQVNPKENGDLPEGIMMMRIGDSATFVMSPEKFFISMMNYRELPAIVKDQKEIYFDIKLLKIYPEPPVMKAERMDAVNRKSVEGELIEKYVMEKNITAKPTASGLYFVEIIQGSGKKAEAGKRVKVHFKGSLFDGKVFDSSYERNRPVVFTLGQGEMIPAWDEAIAMMAEGGKALLIVPSALGYGAEQRNNIKPFTPLVFEVELIEVVN
ncbi:MAG: FKBP-type peptidyl-prolyl cis-trans isomerase [Bacteroidales bacterium]|nr:FKBP-type peptidyl-prolyl cis-trans isomerase [Bacteroidales bacterium]